MAMEFFAFLALGSLMETQFLEGVWKKIELLKNIWAFIFEIPYWLNYHNYLDENVQTLKRKMEALSCREGDVKTQVKNAERSNPRNTRRREVENWLGNVQRKKNDVRSIEQNNGTANFLLRAWLGSRIEKNIQELDELLRQGEFPVGLVLESHQTREVICRHTLLDSQKGTLEKIWASVMNDEVLIVGVHGIAGVGKTTITEHIYNRLIEYHHNFDHVYRVTVLPEWEIVELQDKIAREIGLDLDEKDENKGAAKLYQAFEIRKKTLLILDGVSEYFPLHKVGISNQVNGNGCKVILTTRSLKVCRKMAYTYREIIEVEPLPLDEAEKLFMEELGPIDHCAPEIKQCAKLIVRECKGLPLAITTRAVNLRGVDSISEWRNELNELREVENGIQD